MIDSETIEFTLATFGRFRLDVQGLTYLGPRDELDDKKEAKAATAFFNSQVGNAHLTPLEALEQVSSVFGVSAAFVADRKVYDRKSIETPQDGDVF